MPWAAGHSVVGKSKYDQPIAATMARHAYETGVPQYWEDTESQTEFRQNPLASAPTRSMVSIPIRKGDDILGVFDAVSSEEDAFDRTEQRFLVSLAGVIAVAVSVWRPDGTLKSDRGSL
jgi:putative methionine-R-sulfoxide reductase with GAF domain